MHNREQNLPSSHSNFLKKRSEDPINWHPFDQKSLEKAHSLGLPIFLTVGFSSCHWCELMGHESFKNESTAEFINENFYSIAVDREEQPDIDSYFQQASHHLSGRSGWPLNCFLTSDAKPFFTTNYIPKASGEGPSFMEVLQEIVKNLKDNPGTATETADNIFGALKEGFKSDQPVQFEGHFPHPMAILNAISQFKNEADGGFATAPRFPNVPFYEWTVEQIIEGMVEQDEAKFIVDSLEKMLMGGIIDHVRGGIHRYTVDEKWKRPHFEKQLHAQASLIRLLAKLGLVYPSPLVFDTLINTLDYLATEMHAEEHFFFSSQHADSDGGEGLYYTFTVEEFEDAINKGDDTLSENSENIKKWLSITKEGNFWGGLNIISLNGELRQEFLIPENWELIRLAKKALWEERKKRMPPATDNKAIASWNFSMVSSLCDVIQYSKIDIIRNMASSILLKTLPAMIGTFATSKSSEGFTIKHTSKSINKLNYFEDYVFFAEAQLRVYELTGNPAFKQNLKEVLSIIEKKFSKENRLYTQDIEQESEHQIHNQEQSSFDGSFRSPVTTYLNTLRRASRLFKDKDLQERFERLKGDYTEMILRNPINSGEGLRALTYPDVAYRVLEIPKKWLHEDKFTTLLPYFMPRFIMNYNGDDSTKWKILNDTSSEFEGEDLESFITQITPKEQKT